MAYAARMLATSVTATEPANTTIVFSSQSRNG